MNLKPIISEISYSIELTQSQWEILEDKCASDFITLMENQTQAEKIHWVGYSIFVTLHYNWQDAAGNNHCNDSIEKVTEFLEESLGTE